NSRSVDLQLAGGNLRLVLVAHKCIASDVQVRAAARHNVFCAQRRSSEHAEYEQECRASHNTIRYTKGVLQRQGAASRNANCSMAKATPFSSFVPVSCQPYVFKAGTLFPITTGMPANESISRSL